MGMVVAQSSVKSFDHWNEDNLCLFLVISGRGVDSCVIDSGIFRTRES